MPSGQRLEASARRPPSFERGEHGRELAGPRGEHRADELVLGLEVVVDVSGRHIGGFGDLYQRRRLHTLAVHEIAGAGDEAFAFAATTLGLCVRHLTQRVAATTGCPLSVGS